VVQPAAIAASSGSTSAAFRYFMPVLLFIPVRQTAGVC
jgi:hypothetical protein